MVGRCRVALFAAAMICGVSGLARAAELQTLSLPGFSGALKRLAPQFEIATGHKIAAEYLLNAALISKVNEGAPVDGVITIEPDYERMASAHAVLPDTKKLLGKAGIVLWMRAGAPKPDLSTTDKFKQMLMTARSISYTRESGNGKYLAALIERLGLADQVNPKTKYLGGGGQNPRAVAAGDVEYGLSLSTDGVDVPGIEVAGSLPEEVQLWSVFSGVVATKAAHPTEARQLIEFLASADAVRGLREAGFAPAQ